MALPLVGIVLFFLYPWQVALLPYLMLVAASALFDVLMMRAMRLRASTGREGMIGSAAVVLSWTGSYGQVVWNGEIWRAAHAGPLAEGDRVVIDDVRGLTLVVRAAGPASR